MRFDVITLFPDLVKDSFNYGVTGRALTSQKILLNTLNPRDFSKGVHKSVDDTTAGGGPGMILKSDILGKAINNAYKNIKDRKKFPLIYLTPRGKQLTQNKISQLSKKDGMILLCGRYEGIDQRVSDYYKIEEYSIGDFILSGGETASFVFIDTVVRLLPGVLGNDNSAKEESFEDYLLEYPQYTKPQNWEGKSPPEVLLSGDHAKIKDWRLSKSEAITRRQRPDLWKKYLNKKNEKH